MKFFLDTANLDELREAQKLGIVDGVTTNPTLIAKEGKDFRETIQAICDLVDGPVCAEVMSLEAKAMVREGEELASWGDNIVVKIPMTRDGLIATHRLAEKNIHTNVTLIFNANQALLAARAGATYVCPFVGRLDDVTGDGMAMVGQISEIFDNFDFETQIVAASIRNPLHVLDAALAGVDIVTVPPKVLDQMIAHPLTQAGVDTFLKDWEKARKKG